MTPQRISTQRLRSTLAAVSVLCLAGVSAAQAAAGGVGAPGIGDPYFPTHGNGGYDVRHYDIHVDYNPRKDRIIGRTVIDAKATQNLTRFNLDFSLDVTAIRVNGRLAAFNERNEHEVVVRPATRIASGETMEIEVRYRGIPSQVRIDAGCPWIRTPDGAVAVGNPEIAAWWFPSNDHPSDKALFDIAITVPNGTEALSNGLLKSTKRVGYKTTWSWEHTQPMATYATFLAVGEYDITRSRMKDGTPILNAISSNDDQEAEATYAKAAFARTAEIMDWHVRQWGDYPFEAAGNVAPGGIIGGPVAGTQTRVVYALQHWDDGSPLYGLVSEQAHQWFGNSVSVERWKDMWLNEGFATYASWRWSETHGEGTGNELLADYYWDRPQSFWRVRIANPGWYGGINDALWTRGAMTLQALRNRIGTSTFFTLMQTWAAQHRHGNATVEQFIALAEQQSGQDLSAFFTAWLVTKERPALTRANGFPQAMIDAGQPDPAELRATVPSRAKIDAVHQALATTER